MPETANDLAMVDREHERLEEKLDAFHRQRIVPEQLFRRTRVSSTSPSHIGVERALYEFLRGSIFNQSHPVASGMAVPDC
jgi:hypothetical protein